jgi:hypothetical protein
MPDKDHLHFVVGSSVQDLRQVRMPGLEKPFEELTLSELVQLRPGSDVADSYNVNAVTDNISVSTSSVLEELGNIQRVRAMQTVAAQARLDQIRATLAPAAGRAAFGARDASAPAADEVKLASDAFDAQAGDPFKA